MLENKLDVISGIPKVQLTLGDSPFIFIKFHGTYFNDLE